MPLLLAGLLSSVLLASPVPVPPEGAEEVALLACAADDCGDRLFWVSFDPRLAEEPVLVADALLVEQAITDDDETRRATFDDALERARLALIEGKHASATGALGDAERLLEEWPGTPETQQLFALWFMRGVVMQRSGRSSGYHAFARAAATTWNRSVAIPEGLEDAADAYYAALEALLAEGTGTLFVEGTPGTAEYALDGVPLGDPPLRVQVLPGMHRLTATGSRWSDRWAGEVSVRADSTTRTRALFPGGASDRWVAAALAEAVTSQSLEPGVAKLLDDFAQRHELRRVHLLRLDPVGVPKAEVDPLDPEHTALDDDGLPLFELHEVWYDPQLRRFSATR